MLMGSEVHLGTRLEQSRCWQLPGRPGALEGGLCTRLACQEVSPGLHMLGRPTAHEVVDPEGPFLPP